MTCEMFFELTETRNSCFWWGLLLYSPVNEGGQIAVVLDYTPMHGKKNSVFSFFGIFELGHSVGSRAMGFVHNVF